MRLIDLRPGDAGWVLECHGAHYAASDGFGRDFEAIVARALAEFLDAPDRMAFRGWIALHSDGTRCGCAFMDRIDAQTARLRMFYVVAEARGSGLAQDLLDRVEWQAAADGYDRLRITTHESHRAAGRLYARNGYLLTDSRPAVSFGQQMVVQCWEKLLIPV